MCVKLLYVKFVCVKFVCVKLLYVKFVCVKFVCVKFVCRSMCEGRREAGGGGGADPGYRIKTRTPHKVMGKNKVLGIDFF